MTDSLSIGWTRATAKRQRGSYRCLLGFNLVLQTLIAIAVLIVPSFFLDLIGLSGFGAESWARVWAAMVLMAGAFQVPGYLDPMVQRVPNVIGILGRVGLVILYLCLGGGFLWLALFDGFFALVLYIAFRRAIIAELQTRP